MGFVAILDFEARHEETVVGVQIHLVYDQFDVARRIDMAVHVDVADLKAIGVTHLWGLYGPEFSLACNGAFLVADHFLQEVEAAEIGRASGGHVDGYPYSACEAYHFASLSANLEITFGEMAVIAFDPRGQRIFLKQTRKTPDFECAARENPQGSVGCQVLESDAERVGMFCCHFNDVLHQHCRSEFALGVALCGGETVAASVVFLKLGHDLGF